jgi:membrane protease YdiL (CAAX protease family)
MDPVLQSTLIKLGGPTLAVVFMLIAARRRGISNADLGLLRPHPAAMAGWIVAWVVWLAIGEIVIDTFGLDQAQPWPAYSTLVVVLRVLAIGVAGPVSEELLMRGFVLHLLRRIGMNVWLAIAIASISWAALHVQYGPGTIALIAVDGVLLGVARVAGGSLWIPIAMHVMGNLVSIYQSLSLP